MQLILRGFFFCQKLDINSVLHTNCFQNMNIRRQITYDYVWNIINTVFCDQVLVLLLLEDDNSLFGCEWLSWSSVDRIARYLVAHMATYIHHHQFPNKMTIKLLSRFQKCMKAYPSLTVTPTLHYLKLR